MSTIKSKKAAARRGIISPAKLLSTSALTAAGLLALSMNTARADDVVVPDVSAPDPVVLDAPALPDAAPEASASDASWTGFTDEVGTITVETPTDTLTNITQNTSLYVGTSANLDIPEGYHVNIDQASSNYLFVAKAAPDADPTYILGRLTADGRVIIIDRNGVFTGANSSIDVAGIVMTTGDVRLEDLTAGDLRKLHIDNATDGKIELNGQITVADAGLAAFVAPSVVNAGVINAKMGKVALASGEAITLDLYGDDLMEITVPGSVGDALLENSGTINAQGGIVQISAKQAKQAVDNIINISGVVDVSSATQSGGKIILSGGNSGTVSLSGNLDATGVTGGDIDIKGQNINVADTAEIKTDGDQVGGTINVIAKDRLRIAGLLRARGLNTTGFIETSASDVEFTDTASVQTGDWLLDPVNITIDNVLAGVVEGQLAVGNATVTTNVAGPDAGNISVQSVIDWATTNTLNLFANNDITFTATGGLNATGNGNATLTAKDIIINAASAGINLGTGTLSLLRSAIGTIGLGSGIGDMSISQAEMNKITAGNLVVGESVAANSKTTEINAIDIDTTASISGLVQLNALNNAGVTESGASTTGADVEFDDGVSRFRSLEINAADDVVFRYDAQVYTTVGGMVFKADTDANGASGDTQSVEFWSGTGAIVKSATDILFAGFDYDDTSALTQVIADGGAANGSGTVTFARTSTGNISVGDDNGGFHISQGELDNITAGHLVVGLMGLGLEGNVFVDNVDGTAFDTTTFNSETTFGPADITFMGSSEFNLLNVNAEDDIIFASGAAVETHGNANFNADADFGGAGDFIMNAGSSLDSNGGDITVGTGSFSGGNALYSVFLDTGANIDAEGGNIDFNNTGAFHSVDADSVNTSGTGTIDINQFVGGLIQNAIDAIQNTGSGQNTINIGAGTFDETLEVHESNIWLKGSGQGSTFIKPTTMAGTPSLSNGTPWNGQTYAPIVLAQDANNVDVSGITVDGTLVGGNVFGTATAGIAYYNANGDVSDSTVTNAGAFGLWLLADSTKGHGAQTVNVTNVTSSGNWWAALATIGNQLTANILGGNYSGAGASEALDLSNGSKGTVTNATLSTGTHSDQAGISFHGGHDWTITNTTINGGGTGTTGIADDGTAYGVSAANNIAINGGNISNVGTGIDAIGGNNWDVTGTAISSAAAGVGKGIHFAGLTGSNSTISGVNVSGFNIGVHNNGSNGTQINGGTFTNNTTGILINPSSGVTVDGATITGGTTGVDVNSSANSTVKNSTISGQSAQGVLVRNGSNDSTVSGNILHHTGSHAVEVNGSTGVQVANNAIGYTDLAGTISAGAGNIAGDGVLLNNAGGAVVKGNKITQTNGPGAIEILNTNTANIGGAGVGEGNRIRNSANDGVRMQNDSNITVEGNDIDGTGRVNIWGGNINTATIKNNELAHDGLANYGSIHADGGSSWTVSGNTIGNKFPDNNSAGDIGIFLNGVGGTNAINTNTVDSTSSDGIRTANTGNLTISGNQVGNGSFIGGDGIRVDNSAGVQITDNVSYNAAKNGIIVTDGDNANISGNSVEGADQDGIAVVSSDDVQIVNNDLGLLAVIFGQPNVGDSISVTSSDDATISGNEIRNAGTNGIHLDGATDVTITNNQILDSAQIGLLVENGSTVSALTGNIFNGTPTYIENRVAGTNIYAGNNTFNSLVEHPGYNPFVDGFDIDALFELEDKTNHIMDNASYGKVTYIDNNLFVTGNTLGIQAAVDASNVGGFIHVNDDTFTENVLIDKNGLKLTGYGTTVRYDTANDGPGRGPAGAVFTVTADNVNIDPFAFDGLGIANYGINANGADNLIVDGNSFVNFVLTNINIDNSSGVRIFGNTTTGAQKGVHANNSPDVWVYSNTINGATVAGVHISNTNGTDYFSDADVWNNDINSGANAVGVLVDNSNFVTVGAHLTNQPDLDDALNGNVITGGLRGIVVNNSNNAMVRYNHVSNTSSDTIQVNNGTGVQVLNNTLSNIGWDGVQFNASTNGLIKDNSITNVTGASGVAAMFGSNGTVIENNTINGADRLGIYTWNSDNLQIKGNTITDTGREGGPNWFLSAIHLEGVDNSTVDGNIIDNSNGSGIRVGGVGNSPAVTTSGNVIKNNKIQNVDQDGIRITDSTGVQITSNAVGFEADGTTSAGVDNIKGDGILVVNSDGALINKNKVTETHSTAFDKGSSIQVLNSDNVTIGGATLADGNTLTNSGWDYIRIDAEGGTVNNFLVQNNTGSGDAERVGIYTEGLTNSLIDKNSISDTTRYAGIYTNGGNNLKITNNIVNNSDEIGIYMLNTGGLNLIDKNTVKNTGLNKKASDGTNSGDGIRVENVVGNAGLTQGVTISNNSVGYTTLAHTTSAGTNNINGNGISVLNSPFAQVKTNWVIQATGHGIHLNPSPNSLVQGNDIKIVDGHGINISAGNHNVKVDDNDIIGATLDGIHVELSNDIEITKNEIYGDLALGYTGAGGNGIFVQNGLSALIKDNLIRGANGSGGFTGLKGANGDGIFVNNNDAVEIDNNTIKGGNGGASGTGSHGGSGAGGHGIYVTNSQQARIVNNDILTGTGNNSNRHGGQGADKSGIYAVNNAGINSVGYKDGIFIDSNIINSVATNVFSTGDDGIYVENSAKHSSGANQAKVTNNQVRDTGEDGIDVRGTNGVIIDTNIVENVVEHGIRLNPSHNAVINNNTIWDTGLNGITVLSSNNVDVTNNKLHDLGQHGIYGETSNNLYVFNNTIGNGTAKGATVDGIHVNGGRNAEIDQNLIQGGTVFRAGAGNDGIHVVNNREAVITDNIIKGGAATLFGIIPGGVGAERHGIYAENSGAIIGGGLDAILGQFRDGVQITGNQILNNGLALGAGKDGIHVLNSAGGLFGDRALVQSNTVRGVGDDGIFVDNTDGIQVLTNTVSLALNDGIRVENSDLVEIIDNGVSLVGEDGIELLNSNIFDISDNTVNIAGANGILATNVNLGSIDHNAVTLSGNDGISLVTGNLVDIDQNTVTLSGNNGISVVDSNLVDITANNVTLSGNHGIFVDPSFFINIIGNVVALSGVDGIHAEDTIVLNIQDNTVTLSGEDGIDVSNSAVVDVSGNIVTLSADDGIQVVNVLGLGVNGNIVTLSGDDGIDLDDSLFADVNGNIVTLSGNNGIEVSDSPFVDISGNVVTLSGNDGINVDDSWFADITNNIVTFAFGDGIDVDDSLFADINNNLVLFVAGDGIEVTDSWFADIVGNTVLFTGDDGIDVRDSSFVDIENNNILFTLGDGIQVRDSSFAEIDNNFIRFAGDDGIDFEDGFFSSISGNDIRFVDNSGIEINDSGFISVDSNVVSDADVGIFIDPSFAIFVTNNQISNNDIGLYAQGPGNGYIEVTGNTFTNNRVGARFESGIIDLTNVGGDGFGNKFIAGANGLVGIEFEAFGGDETQLSLVRAGGGYTYDGLDYDTLGETLTPTNFGGTLGNQFFDGYSDPLTQQYVTLGRDTFIDPITGDAIWLDASNSTFAGTPFGTFSPAIDGLDAGKLAFLQSMFFHQPDAAGRGIFFFGLVPDDQSLSVLKDPIYDPYNGGVSGLSITITGLPSVGGAPGTPPISNFNAIAPAAGDETPGASTNVADIEPAAGGSTPSQVASCWADAANAAGAGAPVNYSYGGTFEESIAAAANCGAQSF